MMEIIVDNFSELNKISTYRTRREKCIRLINKELTIKKSKLLINLRDSLLNEKSELFLPTLAYITAYNILRDKNEKNL